MQVEEIEKFLTNSVTTNNYVKISFKKRDSFFGLFLVGQDFNDLKTKNFWRIVPQTKLSDFNQSKDQSLARIYSGSEFTRLTLYKESFEG